jgi:hypothetical protein
LSAAVNPSSPGAGLAARSPVASRTTTPEALPITAPDITCASGAHTAASTEPPSTVAASPSSVGVVTVCPSASAVTRTAFPNSASDNTSTAGSAAASGEADAAAFAESAPTDFELPDSELRPHPGHQDERQGECRDRRRGHESSIHYFLH